MSFRSRNTPVPGPLGMQVGRLGVGPDGPLFTALLTDCALLGIPHGANACIIQCGSTNASNRMMYAMDGWTHPNNECLALFFPDTLYISNAQQLARVSLGLGPNGQDSDTFRILFLTDRIGITV